MPRKRGRGRPKGSKNKPGHRAGRPKTTKYFSISGYTTPAKFKKAKRAFHGR